VNPKRAHDGLTIGDVSRRIGVNVETIRYYERMGLMPRQPRTEGGRRAFGPDGMRTLAFIKRARELGFCLHDIRELLSIRQADQPCTEAKTIANRHLDGMRSKMRNLVELERILADAVARCPGESADECTILELLEK
jgi:MerR family mercuric resistance operon transcriptional regulator